MSLNLGGDVFGLPRRDLFSPFRIVESSVDETVFRQNAHAAFSHQPDDFLGSFPFRPSGLTRLTQWGIHTSASPSCGASDAPPTPFTSHPPAPRTTLNWPPWAFPPDPFGCRSEVRTTPWSHAVENSQRGSSGSQAVYFPLVRTDAGHARAANVGFLFQVCSTRRPKQATPTISSWRIRGEFSVCLVMESK